MDLLKEGLRIWALHREFRAVFAELSSRSDQELSEMGLTRGDVARVAYEEAERRVGPWRPADRPEAAGGRPKLASAPGWYRLLRA